MRKRRQTRAEADKARAAQFTALGASIGPGVLEATLTNYELREDGSLELREDGSIELRE